jgi:hypothetical protein
MIAMTVIQKRIREVIKKELVFCIWLLQKDAQEALSSITQRDVWNATMLGIPRELKLQLECRSGMNCSKIDNND